MTEVCICHGLPAYWQKDSRMKAGGWWECPVKRAAHNRTRYTNPERHARVLAQARDYWHQPGGGYVKERLRDLASQRERVVARLHELEQEAAGC